jgi:energy-converting hydrogenase Eha subunit A
LGVLFGREGNDNSSGGADVGMIVAVAVVIPVAVVVVVGVIVAGLLVLAHKKKASRQKLTRGVQLMRDEL